MNLQKGESYDLNKLAFAGWSTPVGYKPTMDGYHYLDYFEGLYDGPVKYLGADTFGVEPLFAIVESIPDDCLPPKAALDELGFEPL